MARIFTVGFETIPSGGTGNGVEGVHGEISTGTTGISRSSSVKRSGNYSARVNGLTASGGSGRRAGFGLKFNNTAMTTEQYFRFYLRIDTLPSVENRIWEVANSNSTVGAAAIAWLTLGTDACLRLYDEDGQIGSASSALSVGDGTWHKIEPHFKNDALAGSQILECRIADSIFATASNRNWSGGVRTHRLGGNLGSENNTAGDWYFDDVALNSTSGTVQNSWCGDGSVVALLPASELSNSGWALTGASTTWEAVSEIPVDQTSYLSSNTANHEVEWSLTDTPAELASDATITVVQLNNYHTSTGNDTSGRFQIGIRSVSGGTQELSAAVEPGSAGWKLGGRGANANQPIHTLHDLPGASTTAWTKATLDTATLSLKLALAESTVVQVSGVVAIVEYIPATGGGTTQVTVDRVLSWDVRDRVRADRVLSWDVRARLAIDRVLSWDVLDRVRADRGLLWDVRERIVVDRSLLWDIRERLRVDRVLSWDLRERVRVERVLVWALRDRVRVDRAVLWAVRDRLRVDRVVAWAVRDRLRVDRVLAWSVRERVRMSRVVRWSVESTLITTQVVVDRVLVWAVRERVRADRGVVWNVRDRLRVNRVLAWSVRERLRGDRIIQWSVRSRFRDDRIIQWGVRERVRLSRSMIWGVRARLRVDRVIRWVIQSNIEDEIGVTRDVVYRRLSAIPRPRERLAAMGRSLKRLRLDDE